MSVQDAQLKCHYNKINENCESTPSASLATCQCQKCQYFAYLSEGVCCPYGTRWSTTLQECVEIAVPLCARHDGTNCLECFEDPARRLVLSNFSYTTRRGYDSIVSETNERITSSKNVFEASYYLSGGICCPVFSTNKTNQCVAIAKANCKQSTITNNVEKCTLCTNLN